MEGTSAPITPIRRLPGGSEPLSVINTAVTRDKMEFHSRGEEGTGIASDIVKVKGEDPATPGLLP